MSKNQSSLDAFLFGTKKTVVEEEEDPLLKFLGGARPQPSDFAKRGIESGGENFLEGIGRGLLYPTRSLTKPGEAEGLSGLAGEFVGMGISFLPFYGAARTVVGGVGALTKPVVSRLASVETMRRMGVAAEGAISFAGYEALAGDTPMEGVRDIPKNLLFGAAGELAIMEGIAAWRGRFPKFIEDTPSAPSGSPVPSPEVALHPDALKIERWFALADEPLEATVEKLKAVQDPQANLHQALVRVTTQWMPGGQIILPGMSDIKGIQKVADDLGLQTAYSLSHKKDGLFDVMLVDTNKSLLKIKDEGLRKKFLGEGTPVLTFQEAEALVLDTHPDLRITHHQSLPGALGDYNPVAGPDGSHKIRLLDEGTPQRRFETFVHEYAHYLHDQKLTQSGIFAPLERIFSRLKFNKTSPASGGTSDMERVRDELKKMTEEVMFLHAREHGLGPNAARKSAQDNIKYNPDYYHADYELIARSMELMFMNPKLARETGPRATRLMASLILRKAPMMKEIMSKEASRIDDIMRDLWVRRGSDLTIWQKGSPTITPKDMRQFGKTGYFPEMQLFVDGKEASFAGIGKDGKVSVKWLQSGKLENGIDAARVQRPTIPVNLKRQTEIVTEVDNVIKKQLSGGKPSWVAMNLRDFANEQDANGFIRRAVLNLEDFEFVTNIRKWAKTELTPEEYQEYLKATMGGAAARGEFQSATKLSHRSSTILKRQDLAIANIMHARGKKGLVLYDNGMMEVIVADETAFTFADQASLGFSRALGQGTEEIAGTVPAWQSLGEGRVFLPMIDDTLRAILREQGVLEHDLPYFLNLTRERYGKALRELADPETRQIVENVETAQVATEMVEETVGDVIGGAVRMKRNISNADKWGNAVSTEALVSPNTIPGERPWRLTEFFVDDKGRKSPQRHKDFAERDHALQRAMRRGYQPLDVLDSSAARSGFERAITNDGRIELRTIASKSFVGSFANEKEATEFVVRSGLDDSGPTLVDLPGVPSAGGDALPPRPQQQLSSGMPLRREGKGARFLDGVNLFGATFTALENVAKSAEKLGFGPAFTRIFNPAQLAILEVDRQLSAVKRKFLNGTTFTEGLQHLEKTLRGVPRARHGLVTEYVEFMAREEIAKPGGLLARGMTQNEIRVAEELSKVGLHNDLPRLMTISRLIQSAGKGQAKLDKTIATMMKFQQNPQVQELLSVFANAPRFKSKAEVMKFLGLTKEEEWAIKLIGDSVKADKDKFSIFAVSRYASAPALKKGFKTGREQFAFEHGMTKVERDAGKEIDDLMAAAFDLSGLDPRRQIGGYWPHMRMWAQHGWNPKDLGRFAGLPQEFIDWSHNRFRTGELDVYNTDPLITAFKYVRGMVMKQQFDPILPDILTALGEVKKKDPRIFKIMSEYVSELQGKPHASFGKLEQAIGSGLRAITGNDPPAGVVTHTVNGLAALAASAAIPFRPALILRNYFESIQKIAPRVGMKYYMKALKYVVDPKTKAEAFEAAVKSRAISPGPQAIRSIHASDEIFGPGAGRMNYKLERMLEKGFKWYQNADDWSRSIAYHAQRMRMAEHYGDYVRGTIDIDTYLERAKILTFDVIDVAEAERLIKAGDLEGATNYLGRTLARETMNRYGHANHPAGWNSVGGRLFGQFGTWPVQYKDYLLQGLSRGTTKDKVEFGLTHFGVMGGTLLGGQTVGVNLMSWIGFPSLTYTGGPFADMTIDLAKSLNGSEAEKALARRNLIAQVPLVGWAYTGRPNSIFLPGSYLLGDLVAASKADGVFETTLEATGFNPIRVEERSAFEWAMDEGENFIDELTDFP